MQTNQTNPNQHKHKQELNNKQTNYQNLTQIKPKQNNNPKSKSQPHPNHTNSHVQTNIQIQSKTLHKPVLPTKQPQTITLHAKSTNNPSKITKLNH